MRLRDSSVLSIGLVLALAGCARSSQEQWAVELVERYDARLIEAYRTGNAALVDDVTSLREGRKILGLIGAKADMGIALDARLVRFEAERVERPSENEATVRARETWSYRDRALNGGAQVGEASTDSYIMQYRLTREGERWVVDRVAFAEPPVIGRATAPNAAPARDFHGFPRSAPVAGSPPGGR